MFMEEQYITKGRIAEEWKSIHDDAIKRSNDAKADFRNDALFLGAVAVALSGFIAKIDPDATGMMMLASVPLLGMLYAHRKSYFNEKIQNAFAEHALQKREDALSTDEVSNRLPRADVEFPKFKATYKKPSEFRVISHFRTVAIAATVGVSLSIYNQSSVIICNRNEECETEISPVSEFAPMTSLRPVVRPAMN